jgi:nucleoid-associated protein YgaU
MTSVSIAKVIASASALVVAGTAALVFAAVHMQYEQKLTVGAVTATTSAPQGAPAVRSDPRAVANETSPAAAATQAPAALAAAQANTAGIAAELSGPETAGKDPSAPSFDIVRVEAGGEAVIAGRASPGATVELLRGGERLAQAVADSAGEFVMVPPRLPAGSYELTLSAKLPDGTVTSSGHGAAVTVADAGPTARAAQSLAEYVPEIASQPHPSAEPRLRTGKLEESGTSRPAHALHAGLPSDDGASTSSVGHAMSSKVVSRGDSLWRISRIIYGDGSSYALVYRANRERIRTPDLIYPGQTLVLPPRHN